MCVSPPPASCSAPGHGRVTGLAGGQRAFDTFTAEGVATGRDHPAVLRADHGAAPDLGADDASHYGAGHICAKPPGHTQFMSFPQPLRVARTKECTHQEPLKKRQVTTLGVPGRLGELVCHLL